jgi:4-amino-4-deoxy-L-arabinose transferase-like glycosyltransferase
LPAAIRSLLLVALCAGTVCLANLGGPALWDEDEPKNARCAQEMYERGDLVVPTFNGRLRFDKPILIYWLMQAAYALLGTNEFAARLPSAASGIVVALITFRLAAQLFDLRAGLWAGLVLPTSLLFVVSARAATTDAALTACTTGGIALLAVPVARYPKASFCAGYGCLGLAALAKGPTGFLLPLTVLWVWRWLCAWLDASEPRPRAAFLRRVTRCAGAATRGMRPFLGLAICLLVAAPWYVAVGLATGGEWPRRFLLEHNVGRYLQPREGHEGFPLFYIAWLLLGVLPWSWPVVEGLFAAARRERASAPGKKGGLLLAAWVGVYLLFFTFSSTKLPNYLLPCLPAAAAGAGLCLAKWCRRARAQTPHNAAGFLAGGLLAGLCLAAVSQIVLPRLGVPSGGCLLSGLVMSAGFAVAIALERTGRVAQALALSAATAATLHTLLFAAAAEQVAGRQVSKELVKRVPALADVRARVTSLGHFRPGLVYYAGRNVEQLGGIEQVREQLASHEPGLSIIRRELLTELGALPQGAAVLAEMPVFLKPNRRVVVLGSKAMGPPRSIARLDSPEDGQAAASAQ